jgi:hypothetical protein
MAVLLAGTFIFSCLQSARGAGVKYGRLTGIVADPQGEPLMGATVLVTGPVPSRTSSVETGATVERVITDARGRFTIEDVLPGWYSVQVTSPTRVPALRNGVRVEAGQTSTQRFVLIDIFAPVRFQLPKDTVSSWGDDWKWVLRTSASTRPILRYRQEVAQADRKRLREPSQRLIGVVPDAAPREPLAADTGMASVLAYLRPLSDGSDLLVMSSMTAYGPLASSVATAFRKNLLGGEPQELTLAIHQLSFSGGVPILSGNWQNPLAHAQGAVLSYTQTRRLSPDVTLTAGMKVNCLNALAAVVTVQPEVKLEYQVDSGTVAAFQYGSGRPDSFDTLLERVGMLNAFPQVTLANYRPRLEQLNHAEVSLRRRISKTSLVELAAYHDALHDAAVWGSHHVGGAQWLAGDLLPDPAGGGGIILNAGDYQAAGFRVAYSQDLSNSIQAVVAYALGDALTVPGAKSSGTSGRLQDLLHPAETASLAGKVSARTPVTHTQLTTSYGWVPSGRVTSVDPYGQANLQLPPYLGVEIRQPLPTHAFLPARIEAVADLRNLLAQGYAPVDRGGERPVFLSSAYRSFRGGFSLQF